MFRLYDYLVLLASGMACLFSTYLFFNVAPLLGVFVGIWGVIILGFGIHVKLVRIVHFVLYKSIKGDVNDNH